MFVQLRPGHYVKSEDILGIFTDCIEDKPSVIVVVRLFKQCIGVVNESMGTERLVLSCETKDAAIKLADEIASNVNAVPDN